MFELAEDVAPTGKDDPVAGAHGGGAIEMKRQAKPQTPAEAQPSEGGQAQPTEQGAEVQVQGEAAAPPSRAKKCCLVLSLVLFVGVLVLINWLCYRFVALLLPRTLAALVIIGGYYLLARRTTQYFAFPGSFGLSSRRLEFEYAQRMAYEMGKSLHSFRNMTQFFVMTLDYAGTNQGGAPLICDTEKTFQFIYECSRVKKMIK